VARVPAIMSFIRSINSRRATVAVGEREELLYGKPYITERIGGSTFEITASSFFQTNSKQAENLYATVLEAANLGPEDRLLDLYSGTGTISILAAGKVQEVRGVESHPDSVRNAERNAALNGHRNCFFIRADAKKALSAMAGDKQPPTVMTVNPPRAGLNKGVVHHMLQLKPERIVYVSCNPATLARDLGLICDRDYTLNWVKPVDMFPHTAHIECVAQVERTPGTKMKLRAPDPEQPARKGSQAKDASAAGNTEKESN
jgi:23S rRNA (uracil1939-C5)-methyltransferase